MTAWRDRGLLLVVMGIWGLNLPVIKWLTGHFDVVVLAGLRMLVGAVFLACLLQSATVAERRGRPPFWPMAACAFLTVYAYQLLVTEGVRLSSATNSALLSALHPVIAAVIAFLLLGERLAGRGWLGSVLGLAGVAIVILQAPSARLEGAGSGELLITAGLVLHCGGALILQQLLTRGNAVVVSFATQAVGAVLLLAQVLVGGWWRSELPALPPLGWPWFVLLLSGALSTGVAGLMWNRAISREGATRASMWLYWVPVFGILAAAVLLGEAVTGWHLLALAFVIVGTRLAEAR
jgi:drug/metabolite transporter (DMT)-like permease